MSNAGGKCVAISSAGERGWRAAAAGGGETIILEGGECEEVGGLSTVDVDWHAAADASGSERRRGPGEEAGASSGGGGLTGGCRVRMRVRTRDRRGWLIQVEGDDG